MGDVFLNAKNSVYPYIFLMWINEKIFRMCKSLFLTIFKMCRIKKIKLWVFIYEVCTLFESNYVNLFFKFFLVISEQGTKPLKYNVKLSDGAAEATDAAWCIYRKATTSDRAKTYKQFISNTTAETFFKYLDNVPKLFVTNDCCQENFYREASNPGCNDPVGVALRDQLKSVFGDWNSTAQAAQIEAQQWTPGSIAGLAIGLLLLIALIIFFVMYGIPRLRKANRDQDHIQQLRVARRGDDDDYERVEEEDDAQAADDADDAAAVENDGGDQGNNDVPGQEAWKKIYVGEVG